MRNKIRWMAVFVVVAVMLVACAPAETVPEPVQGDVEPENVLGETGTPVVEAEPTIPAPTETATIEPARPTATPLPRIEPAPESTAEVAPEMEIDPEPLGLTAVPPDDPYLQELIDKAKSDLAQRTGIGADEIILHQYMLVTWSDASLGCPKPGMEYAQVLVDGYQIMLQAGLGIYNYHGGGYPDSGPFLCEDGIDTKIIVPPPSK